MSTATTISGHFGIIFLPLEAVSSAISHTATVGKKQTKKRKKQHIHHAAMETHRPDAGLRTNV
jgi:hypothetical protein